MTDATRQLASYTAATNFEDHPAEVVAWAKVLIRDNLGCMLGGSITDLSKTMIEPIRSMGGAPEATLVGAGIKVPAIQAALVNGTTANALDYDDTLAGLGHPGATIIPSALAMGQWRGKSGREVLNAIITAYEVCNRVAWGIQPTKERLQQVWGVGTWLTFGGVAAAGKLMDLDTEGMRNAFGVAGGTAPLPNTQKWGWDQDERPIHWVKEPTGWPAWCGTLAAILAAGGFLGNRYILDGDNGFWIMAGSDKCDFDRMTKDLGKNYEIMDLAIKPYSSCRWQHAALDCVREIKNNHNLTADQVEKVVINSFSWVKRHEVYDPEVMVDAQFCIPHTTTQLLHDQPPGPNWYSPDTLNNAELKEYSRRVSVEIDPDMERAYFEEDKLSARVEITTTSGENLSAFVNLPRGEPDNPVSPKDLEDKFRFLAGHCLDKATVEKTMARLDDLENLANISELMDPLGG